MEQAPVAFGRKAQLPLDIQRANELHSIDVTRPIKIEKGYIWYDAPVTDSRRRLSVEFIRPGVTSYAGRRNQTIPIITTPKNDDKDSILQMCCSAPF